MKKKIRIQWGEVAHIEPEGSSGIAALTQWTRPALALTVFCLLMSCIKADAGLRIYYIRHAEAGHNVREDWEDSDVSEDEWPDYVGDPNQFTPKGRKQLEAVSATLQELEYRFDFIGSSPLWRSRNTILPYMKDVGDRGEVWPELAERHTSSSYLFDPKLPTITDPILGEGSEITLPAPEVDWFSLRKDGQFNFRIPDYKRDERSETAASKLVIEAAIDLILKRFGGTDSAILLAGHGASGKTLIRMLTNDVDADSIDNTGIWMVEQQADGTFKRLMYNSDFLEKSERGVVSTTVRFDELRADLSDGEINGESARDSDVTITKKGDGLDNVYSFRIDNQDYDGVGGFNDSLSWDIRVSGFTGGNVTENRNDSSVALGAPSKPHMSDAYFGVSEERYLEENDSIQFSVENLILKATPGTKVQFNGFDGIYGSDDSYIFGVADGGLESQLTSDDDDINFRPRKILTISCPLDKFRIRDLSGSFTVTNDGGVGFRKTWEKMSPAEQGASYRDTLVESAFGDSLVFSKIEGPEWLSVAEDGSLSGSPRKKELGTNLFKIRVTGASGKTDTMTLVIEVRKD